MQSNSIFNATVCIIGILILSIHSLNLIIKKQKRLDEKVLLQFFLFTIFHFAAYLTFTFLKAHVSSDAFILAFYTAFYVMNNLELLLLFRYALSYIGVAQKTKRVLTLVNNCLLAAFILLDFINLFTGIFFTAENGVYFRSKTMILSQGYQFYTFVTIFLLAMKSKKLSAGEKTAFGFYCFLPFAAIILQNIFKGYAIAYTSIIVTVEILFLFLNVQKNEVLAKEEEKMKETQIKLMLSQIQPHFVYNSLSSISTLISIDPEKAQTALDNFTEYLRHNISSLTEKSLILFEEELKHIKSYVALEKMRFGERVRVVYDVQATGFFVPPLSIQPLVENAMKHGILKKLEGGTLTIRTYETPVSTVVEVVDDGVGFQMEDVDFSGNRHFGLNNIKYRVEKTCGGEVIVESEIDKGTRVRVIFHKKELQ